MSRYEYRKAGFGMQNNISLAVQKTTYGDPYSCLIKAKTYLPTDIVPFLCQGDLQRIHTSLGKIWYEQGRHATQSKIDRYVSLQQSYQHYTIAVSINPYDILAIRGIADTVAALEFTFTELFPQRHNKYNALPLFERVAEIEPNGVKSNYAKATYLYKKGLAKALYAQVQHTAKIYPLYGRLKKKQFYSTEIRTAIETGLLQAIKENIMVAKACFSLSKFYEDEKQYTQAVRYYSKALKNTKKDQTTNQHLQFGTLLLHIGNTELARDEFLAALQDKATFSRNVRIIYYRFKKLNKLSGFIEFAKDTPQRIRKLDDLQLYIAKAQIKLKRFEPAKKTLQTINAQNPNSKAYLMLANLARKEKDWSAMELSIQKATVLEPHNGRYYKILSDALLYQKKYKSAAHYMEKALANDPENPKYTKRLTKIRSYYN